MCVSYQLLWAGIAFGLELQSWQEEETKDLFVLMLRIFPGPLGWWWFETHFLPLVCDNPACATGVGTG